MNANEIITALECCIAEGIQGCKDCPLFEFSRNCDECRTELMKQVLDIIKRKNAESEELKRRNQKLTSENENLTSALKSAKAEIERLKNSDAVSREYVSICDKEIEDWKSLCNDYKSELLDVAKRIKHIASEARKELAERLKEKKVTHKNLGELVYVDDIDNLLAEMEERE